MIWDRSSTSTSVEASFSIEIVYEQVASGSVTTTTPVVDNRFIYEGTKLMGLSAEGEEYFKQSENKELIIPEGTTEIADGAFFVPYGYEGEKPDFLFFESLLADYILNNLTDEEKLKFEKENELFSAISEYNIQNSRLKDYTVKFPNSLISIGRGSFASLMLTGDLIIPNSVKEIGSMAFTANGFNGILKLSNSLSKIDIQAFAGNQFSGGLTIPDSVASIEFNAFFSSGFSSNLVLSKNLKKIDMMAFAANQFIGGLVIPDSVTEIGMSAFGESGFTGTLTLPNSITKIENGTFSGTGFTGELYIPDTVTDIDYNAFWDCNNLTSVSIPSSTTYKEVASGGDDPSFPTGIPINKR